MEVTTIDTETKKAWLAFLWRIAVDTDELLQRAEWLNEKSKEDQINASRS